MKKSTTPSQFSDDQSLTSFFDDGASEAPSSFYEPSDQTREAFLGLAQKLNMILGDMPEETPQETKDAIGNIIAEMLSESPIQAEALVARLDELTGISSDLKGKFEEILEEIAKLGEVEEFKDTVSEISYPDKNPDEFDAVATEHLKPKFLSDIVTSESSEILEPSIGDKVADELANMPNPALESDAERIAREEEERNSNYNHFSSSKDLDPNIAAAGIKLAGVLAIALGIGGPAGLILAGLFLIATKNIANGKTVTHINSGDEARNTAPEVGDNFLRNMMQSAQAQIGQNQTVSNTPTNIAASTGQALKDMQAGLTPHQQTLENLGTEAKIVDAKQPQVDKRTDKSLKIPNSPRSDGSDISSPGR